MPGDYVFFAGIGPAEMKEVTVIVGVLVVKVPAA
jgi:hypothetical protein